jgi:hypothetical protein
VKKSDAERQTAADLMAVLSSPVGRRFVWRLIDDDSLSFDLDDKVTAFREGARSLRLELRQQCKAVAVEQYKTMVREQLDALDEPEEETSVE